MKKFLIKSVSLFVCVLLVITSIPLSALADGGIEVITSKTQTNNETDLIKNFFILHSIYY